MILLVYRDKKDFYGFVIAVLFALLPAYLIKKMFGRILRKIYDMEFFKTKEADEMAYLIILGTKLDRFIAGFMIINPLFALLGLKFRSGLISPGIYFTLGMMGIFLIFVYSVFSVSFVKKIYSLYIENYLEEKQVN